MVSGVETEVLRVVGTSLIDSRLDLSQAAFNGELRRPAECLREPQEVAGTSHLGKMFNHIQRKHDHLQYAEYNRSIT